MNDGIYAQLVERLYAMPPHKRAAGAPLQLTWDEFTEVWNEQQAHDDRFNETVDRTKAIFNIDGEHIHTVPRRPPTMDDAKGSRVLGCLIEIVDEYGLRMTREPTPTGKLELIGGPMDGRIIDAPTGVAVVCVPSVLPSRISNDLGEIRFWAHRYNARTGIYQGGRMPSDRIAIYGEFAWFGKRIERLLAWWERRRRP